MKKSNPKENLNIYTHILDIHIIINVYNENIVSL